MNKRRNAIIETNPISARIFYIMSRKYVSCRVIHKEEKLFIFILIK